MSGVLSAPPPLYIGSGAGVSGNDSGTTIEGAGIEYVGYDSGVGFATGTIISAGGYQIVGDDDGIGTATFTSIFSGGRQIVGEDGGTGSASGTTVSSGGAQDVGEGGNGTATDTTLIGGFQYLDGGAGAVATAIDTTIGGGGNQFVGDYGTGTATNTTIVSGDQFLGYHGAGTATSTTIDSGGAQFVGYAAGTGIAIGATLDGGEQYVGNGAGTTGTSIDTTISGGQQLVGYLGGVGTASNTTIDSGGSQYVGDAGGTGTAIGATIESGGLQYVGQGGAGTASNTAISGGEQYVYAEGVAEADTLYSGGYAFIESGGVADAPVIDGGVLYLTSGASIASGAIDFAAPSGANGGTLDLAGEGSGATFASDFSAAISGFTGVGDTAALSDFIEVAGSSQAGDKLVWTQDEAAQGTLRVETSGGAVLESLTLEGTYSQDKFALSGAGNVDEITYASCFMAGTLVRTPQSDAAVETLRPGDLVLTTEGVAKPVHWLGRQTISTRFADPLRVLPIRVRAGALDENVPTRDLLLSPDHAILVGDVLIQAGALVNGTSILRETGVPEIFVYYHVELDDHSLILAENTPAETFIDNVDRLGFDNWAEHEALFPLGKSISEMPFPRAKARRQVPAQIRAALDARAKIVGAQGLSAVA